MVYVPPVIVTYENRARVLLLVDATNEVLDNVGSKVLIDNIALVVWVMIAS